MKILTVIGARPQFIKAAPVSKALRHAGHDEFIVHTGQHYDYQMSQVFFDELLIPNPDVNLGVGSASHGKQTAEMLIGIEEVILQKKPHWVLVYGDTNSTLAGALAAAKLQTPLAHIEAGLRSYNRAMPEEHNRVLTDHCANLLFCPTQTAVENLRKEGIVEGVYWVGDTMYDAVSEFAEIALQRSRILEELNLIHREYLLVTIHRSYNTDSPEKLAQIIRALMKIPETIIFPIHPRTRARLNDFNLWEDVIQAKHIRLIEPVGYLDMLRLEQSARIIITDSGGVQKEAYFFRVPCLTLRSETEWVETVEAGWNRLVIDYDQLNHHIKAFWDINLVYDPNLYGHGDASKMICKLLG